MRILYPTMPSFEDIQKQEANEAETTRLLLFDTVDAFEIGSLVRLKALEKYPNKPVVVDVSLALGQVLFHATTPVAGSSLDNDIWIKRKAKTVFRFGWLSYFMGQKLAYKKKSLEQANFCSETEYATHGGAVPIRIEGFDGVLAVLVVSGLAQEQDHQLAIEGLQEYRASQGRTRADSLD